MTLAAPPPFGFSTSAPAIIVPAGAPVVRVHHVDHGPIWFGPPVGKGPTYRFDAPTDEFKTLYAAEALAGAFVETVLRRARRIVARPFVDQRRWSCLIATRDLKLAKLFDEGLIHYGTTSDICAGDDYRHSQLLAGALHATFDDVDGIAYRARHNNGEICFAIFDRIAPSEMRVEETRSFKDEQATVDHLMRLHGAVFDPVTPLPPEPQD